MVSIIRQAFGLGTRVALPLDPGAFRLFLALLVFIHHFSSFALGGYAVYVFFVLSGYWLQRMWSERYLETRAPYLTYLISRVWRLAPVMVLINVITIPLLYLIGIPAEKLLSNSPLHLALSSMFMLGYAWLPFLPVGSAWSLDVEMQFYVVAPLCSILLATRWRAAVLVFAVIGSLLTMNPAETALPASWMLLPIVTPVLIKYLAFFIVGMMGAGIDWSRFKGLAAISAGTFVFVIAAILVSPLRSTLIVGAHHGPYAAYNTMLNVVLAVITIPYAFFTTSRRSDATDRMYADLSYILYLLHWVAMRWFFTITGPTTVRLAVAAVCFVAVPLGSWLIWKYYDKPLNRLRAQWVNSRMRERPAPVARIEAETAIN